MPVVLFLLMHVPARAVELSHESIPAISNLLTPPQSSSVRDNSAVSAVEQCFRPRPGCTIHAGIAVVNTDAEDV